MELFVADLAQQHDVRELARQVADRHQRLDVLVNNAAAVNSVRRVTADGIEATVAVNHLAPFLLTVAAHTMIVARIWGSYDWSARAHGGFMRARLTERLGEQQPRPAKTTLYSGFRALSWLHLARETPDTTHAE